MTQGKHGKIRSRAELTDLVAKLKAQGKRVGFTSGVFDLLHPGHVEYLAQAKSKCDLLVVGLNSDSSVRSYKGPKRPLNDENFRARVLAGLDSVDFIFIFSERRNAENIKALKPNLYIKAGDYSKAELTSAPEVEAYGGQIEIIPSVEAFSTTDIIERAAIAADLPQTLEIAEAESKPAVFIDRDGVINESVEYLHEPEKFVLIEGVLQGLKLLQNNGFRIIIVTNQAGIGLGYFTKEDFYKVNRKLLKIARENSIVIDRVYFCPHSKADECSCRKPKPGMLLRGAEELNIPLADSFMIGDQTTDLQAGSSAGCRTVLMQTGHAGEDAEFDVKPDFVAANLHEAAKWIVANAKPNKKGRVAVFGERDPERTKVLESVGRISSQLGHDLNNLLGSIQGCSDLIRLKLSKIIKGENPVERQLTLINTALAKAEKITRKIRGYVRPGPVDTEELEVAFCVEQALEQLKKLGTKPVEIQTEIRSRAKAPLHEFFVVQMIVNLCLNSIEAMGASNDRSIVIHVEDLTLKKNAFKLAAGEYVRLSIMDHGKGLSEPLKEQLFEPFFSTHQKSIGESMGLSLAMANELMMKHNGAISIESLKDVGTVVHLYFPKT